MGDGIPEDVKENVYFIIENKDNVTRRNKGEKSTFWDDCGSWCKGSTPRSHFEIDTDGKLKSLMYRGGKYYREKQVNRKRTQVELNPQPTNVVVIHRYYSVLQCDKRYRRRISWIAGTTDAPLALVEYVGEYPQTTACHGNSKKNPDDDYRRTKPKTLEKISNLAKYQAPRDVYRALTAEDTLDGPRDFKQCQNKAQNDKKKREKTVQ